MRQGWVVSMTVLLACGPAVSTSGNGTSTGDGTGPAPGLSTSSGPAPTTVAPGSTTLPPMPGTTSTSTGVADTSSSAADASSSSGDDPPDCSCKGTPIGVDEASDDGLVASELIESFNANTWQIYWHALTDTPEPIAVEIILEHDGGTVFDEVGGCCGQFLCVPCPEGLTVGVTMRVTSADGLLDEVVAAQLTGDRNTFTGVTLESEQITVDDAGGTWALQTFVEDGAPIELQSIGIRAFPNEDPEFQEVRVREFDGLVLGTSFETNPF